MRIYKKLFNKIVDLENLFLGWENFRQGKNKRPDVALFEKNLEQNIFALHRDLISKTYQHAGYSDFYICDPKKRHIYKATIRDRVLHHATYNILNPIFDPIFISKSFSCRIGKGNHKGTVVAEKMIREVSKNYTRPCFVLKCDIKKFFDTIDHSILLRILKKKIKDREVIDLLKELVESYETGGCFTRERERERE